MKLNLNQKKVEKKEDVVVKEVNQNQNIQNDQIIEDNSNTNDAINNHIIDVDDKNKYGQTIYKLAGKNTLCEVSTNGFSLCPKDSKGNRKELTCYIAMNFVEYNDKYQQIKYIPFYLKSINWRGLRMDFMSGYLDTLAAKERAKGNKYCSPIYTFNGGTPKGPNGKPLCRVLQIVPAAVEGSFLLVALQGEGVAQKNGTITFKSGATQTRISIRVTHDMFGGLLDEVSSCIPTPKF